MSTAVALPRPRTGSSRFRFVSYEVLLWLGLYPVYLAIRGLSIDSFSTALANAHDLISVERSLSLFHEDAVQEALSSLHGFLSTYYMLGFGPVGAATLIWLAFMRREYYVQLRTALFVSLAFAAVSYALLPMAPPRLVPDIGIADTVGLAAGHDTGSFGGVLPFNPYAAMPSMHVGWSLLVGIFGFRALRGNALRWVFALHPVLMAVTVSATGNHYFLDSAAGVAVVLSALLAIRLFNRNKR
ncbi:MAG: phosphatase PAP2 family protein [Microterricola sp.]